MKNYNYLFKYVIVGSTSVGKSCLLLQFVDKKFRDAHQVTMGVEFGTNIINIQNNIVKLHIWDTAGQESFSSMVRSYYRNAIGCIMVFDLTNKDSFQSLIKWHSEVLSCTGKEIKIIIVGNKSDLQSRQVSSREGQDLADSINALYIEASALSGNNVDEIFQSLTSVILKSIANKEIDPSDEVYGIKVGDFEKRRNSILNLQSKRCSVQVSYPIQNQRQCC